jgi:ketosteroid isomerase-like protein
VTAKETVQALYAAYAAGDPDRIAALLHPDVIWVAPAGNATQVALGLGSADDAGPPRGLNDLDRDAIVAFMTYDYPRFVANVVFEPRSMVGEGGAVLAEHRMSATLPNGRPYINDYCFAYEVSDGRVTAIREYMDTRGGWLQVFGGDPPGVLLAQPAATAHRPGSAVNLGSPGLAGRSTSRSLALSGQGAVAAQVPKL